MKLHNIYISTYTTFELIRILWSTYEKLQKTSHFQFIKRWSLEQEMDKIMKGFLSRELTSQSNAIMNLVSALPEVSKYLPLELNIINGLLFIATNYTVEGFTKGCIIRYDPKHKSFNVDIDPTPNAHDGLSFTITFGQKAPSHIMKLWQTVITDSIEKIYHNAVLQVVWCYCQNKK